MVAKEAQKSFQMEKTTKMLEEELAQTRLRLEAESTQLRELRKKMTEFVAEREAQDEVLGEAIAGGNVASLAATLGRAEPGSRNSFIAGGGDDPRKSIDSRTDDEDDQLDQTMFAEFLEFVAQLSGYKLAQVGKLPFMKTAVEDDIEPVLRFGGNPQVSSKKIIDSIIENRILVQEVTANSPILNPPSPAPKFSQSEPNLGSTASAYAAAAAAAAAANKTPLAREKSVWERFSGLPGVGPPNVCQACGNTTPNAAPCRFQFRLSEADPWSALCGTCRDRLVSACDFYNFVRHVKTGLMANRPNMELYKEALRLKRQMFYARCGAMHLAQQERGFGRFRLRTLGRPSTPETGRSDEPPTLRRAPTAPSPLNPSALAMAQQQAAPPPLSQSAPANPAGGDMPQLAMPPLNKRT